MSTAEVWRRGDALGAEGDAVAAEEEQQVIRMSSLCLLLRSTPIATAAAAPAAPSGNVSGTGCA